jgi:geranylgeranyl diphosphate synthase type II
MSHVAPLNLIDELKHARELVDSALHRYMGMTENCPSRLAAAMQYSLLAPGKRMRPILVLWSAEVCGHKDVSAALPAACAVEMIHAYSLVHDDLPAMDNDDLRRGRPTCHKAFDEATAILAGDGLLTLAFQLMASEIKPAALAGECCAILAQAAGVSGMVGGQADDLVAEGRYLGEPAPEHNLHGLGSIHARKTGAMIRASMKIGAVISKADLSQVDSLEQFGAKIGLAFQIADDLLDVSGTEENTGKRVGKDQSLGKMTYPALCGVEESRRMATQLIDEARALLLPFGNAGSKLDALACYVVERNH